MGSVKVIKTMYQECFVFEFCSVKYSILLKIQNRCNYLLVSLSVRNQNQNPATVWNHHPSSFFIHSSFILKLLSFSACLKSACWTTLQPHIFLYPSVTLKYFWPCWNYVILLILFHLFIFIESIMLCQCQCSMCLNVKLWTQQKFSLQNTSKRLVFHKDIVRVEVVSLLKVVIILLIFTPVLVVNLHLFSQTANYGRHQVETWR